MIALATPRSPEDPRELDGHFLHYLPRLRKQAEAAFRSRGCEQREECVQEVIANVYQALVHLERRGKPAVAYLGPLTRFAIRQVRQGRRVGSRQNCRDVLTSLKSRPVRVERLDAVDPATEQWREVLVEDRRSTPDQIAAMRIDFAAWLASLPGRLRAVAQLLSTGETTGAVARQLGVSSGRVSQLRLAFRQSWSRFQGEPLPA
jgi:RNA polymerase sigma factor (sigma-70 family)